MSQHTPGPWKHGYSDGSGRFGDDDRHGGCIVTKKDETVIVGWGSGPDGEAEGVISSEADATLIAAAPDLLKACRGLLAVAKIAMPDSYFESDSRVRRARAAIASALGQGMTI